MTSHSTDLLLKALQKDIDDGHHSSAKTVLHQKKEKEASHHQVPEQKEAHPQQEVLLGSLEEVPQHQPPKRQEATPKKEAARTKTSVPDIGAFVGDILKQRTDAIGDKMKQSLDARFRKGKK